MITSHVASIMKRGLEGGRGKQTFVVSGKRSRYDDEDDSDSSQEPLEGNSSTKSLEELKAITWKSCEPAPVVVDGGESIAVNGSTVYMLSRHSNILYEFNSDKRVWVSSIKCDRKLFGLAVINGDLTLVGGRSLDDSSSSLKTLTSLVKSRSSVKWIQKYPPMRESKAGPCCCSDEHLLLVGQSYVDTLEIMDTNKRKWINVNFPNNYGVMSSMTIVGDRVYVLTRQHSFNSYCTIRTCFLSALLLEPQSLSINQPLIWHKVHPICDFYRPCLANFSGNLVAVGGKVTTNTYSDLDGRDCTQYSISPKLYVYSDKVNSLGSEGWNFVADLPMKRGYPNADFLVATIQGHRLIVCGGNHTEVERDLCTNADDSVSSFATDIVHMGLLN